MEQSNQTTEKLCPNCGVKNAGAYGYCANCGAPLNTPVQPLVTYAAPAGAAQALPLNADLGGVMAGDLMAYTNSKSLFSKISTIFTRNKGAIWCWPLFLFGFFFGFIGMGCWYLYRRLYKHAAVFLALGVLSYVAQFFAYTHMLDGGVAIMRELFPLINTSGKLTALQTEQLVRNIVDAVFSHVTTFDILSLTAFSLAHLALAIVMPFFAYKSYATAAIKRIRRAKAANPMVNVALLGKPLLLPAILVAVGSYIVLTAIFSVPIVPFVQEMLRLAEQYGSYRPAF